MNTLKGTPTAGLVGATVGFFIGFAGVSLFGPTASYLQRVSTLTPAMAGLLISIPSFSGSLLRIPFSAMVDRDGGRRAFLILLVAALAGLTGLSILFSAAEDVIAGLFPLVLFLGILAGAGIATFSVGISQTAYWFPRSRQGVALGIYAGIGNLAPGIFALIVTRATLPALGMSGSYWVWTAFLAVGIMLYFLLGRNAWYFQLRRNGVEPGEARSEAERLGQEIFPRGSAVETLKMAAGTFKTWGLVLVYFTSFGGFMALTAWLPKYWVGLFGFNLAQAGLATFAFATLASLLRIAGGAISDRIGGYAAAFGSLALILAAGVGLTFAFGAAAALVLLLLMALGMGVANAAVFKLVPQELPHAVGGASGWVGGLGAFGGFVIPNLMAAFLGTGSAGDPGYARGFIVFAALAVVGAVALYLVCRAPRPAAATASA